MRTIDAKLEPLSASGGLRVEDPALAGAEVIVDGVTVGIAPWEGTLARTSSYPAKRESARRRPWPSFSKGKRRGLAIELAGGYVDIHAPLNRVLSNRFISDNGSYIANFALHDDVRLAGFFVGPAIGYRARLGRGWGLRSRVSVGALLAKSTDPVVATTFTGSDSASALVQNAHESVSSTAFFTSFDLGVERTFGKWRVGVGLAVFVVPSSGATPFNHTAVLTQSSTCTTANPGAVGCVPESAVLQGERPYGPFLLATPQLTLSWLP